MNLLLSLAFHLLLLKNLGAAASPHRNRRSLTTMVLFFICGLVIEIILAAAFGIHLKELIAIIDICFIVMRRKGFTNMRVGVLHVCVALELNLGERPLKSAI